MAGVGILRVYRRDIAATDTELLGRLQALAELELARVRDRTRGHDRSVIEAALSDGLARVTAGTVDEQDLPLAAAAVQRDDEFHVELLTPPSPATRPTDGQQQ